eukprot:s489_g11.t1
MAGSGGSYWSTLSQDPSWAWLSREDSRPVQGTEDETQLGGCLTGTGACRIQNSKLFAGLPHLSSTGSSKGLHPRL